VTEATGVHSKTTSAGESGGFIPLSRSTRQIQNNSLLVFHNIGEELFYRTSSQAKEQLLKKVEESRTGTSVGNFRPRNIAFD